MSGHRPYTGRRTYNQRLPPVPDDCTVLAALVAMWDAPTYDGGGILRNPWRIYHGGVLASALAARLGMPGSSRLGRGAVAGSWSGSMDAGLRLVPRLRSLERRGLVHSYYDLKAARTRSVYRPTPAAYELLA